MWREKYEKSSFLFRVRNEHRWYQVLDENGDVDRVPFSDRLRFLISGPYKIFKNEKLLRLVVADEMRIHFGEEIVYNTFDQNRIL